MTLIAGIIIGRSTYLVADSVVTMSPDPANDTTPGHTTFGEVEIKAPDRSVVESAMKLVVLGRGVACACAGDARTLRQVTTRLRADVANMTIEEALEREHQVTKDEEFHILIAADVQGPRLFHLSQRVLEGFLEPHEFRYYGSMDVAHINLMAQMLPAAFHPYDPDQTLAGIVAIAQARGQVISSMSRGVGGVFVGLRVDHNGVHPHRPTAFVLYQHENSSATVTLERAVVIQTGWLSHDSAYACRFLGGVPRTLLRSWFAGHDDDRLVLDWSSRSVEFPGAFALLEVGTGCVFLTPSGPPFFDWSIRPPVIRPDLGASALDRVRKARQLPAGHLYFTRVGAPVEAPRAEHPVQLHIEVPFGFECVGLHSEPGSVSYTFRDATTDELQVRGYVEVAGVRIEVWNSPRLAVTWEVDQEANLVHVRRNRDEYTPAISVLTTQEPSG